MSGPNHYDVLGVGPDADAATIRESYRTLARAHHPDRAGPAREASERRMAEINAAYHVLSDPARRAVYDSQLRSGAAASAPRPPSPGPSAPVDAPRSFEPARIPWRSLSVFVVVAVAAVFVLAQFTEPGEPAGPDGILRTGDCVEVERDTFAREVACTGTDDLVVRRFIPFDGDCGSLTYLQDVQGMGAVCVERAVGSAG